MDDSRLNQFSAKLGFTERVRLREDPSGRQAWAPPTSPVQLERSGRNPLFTSVMPVSTGVTTREDPPGRGGAGTFTQVCK